MSAQRKTVFVSCGQYSEEERALGKRVAVLVRECTPFDGYFAENQTTLATRVFVPWLGLVRFIQVLQSVFHRLDELGFLFGRGSGLTVPTV